MSFVLPSSKVGSKDWILKEQTLASDLVSNDLEDFAFSARRELEWLNEHLIELMEPNNEPRNIASLFQTPGKIKSIRSPVKLAYSSDTLQENIDVSTGGNASRDTILTVQPAIGRAPNLHVKFDNLQSNTLKTPGAIRSSPLKPRNIAFSDPRPTDIDTPLARDSHSHYDESDLNGSFLAISRSVNKSAHSKTIGSEITENLSNAHSTPLPNNLYTPGHRLEFLDQTKTVESLKNSTSSVDESPISLASLPARVPLPKKSSTTTPAPSRLEATEIPKSPSSVERPTSVLEIDDGESSKEPVTSSDTAQTTTVDEPPIKTNGTTHSTFVHVLKKATKFMFDRPDSSKTNLSRSLSKTDVSSSTNQNASQTRQKENTPHKVQSSSIFARLATPTFASSSKSTVSSSPMRSQINTSPSRESSKTVGVGMSPIRARQIKPNVEAKPLPIRSLLKEKEVTKEIIQSEAPIRGKDDQNKLNAVKTPSAAKKIVSSTSLKLSPAKPVHKSPVIVDSSKTNSKLTTHTLQPKKMKSTQKLAGKQMASVKEKATESMSKSAELTVEHAAKPIDSAAKPAEPLVKPAEPLIKPAEPLIKPLEVSEPQSIKTAPSSQPKVSRSLAQTSLSVKSNPKAKHLKQEKMKAASSTATIPGHLSSKSNTNHDLKPIRSKLMNSIPEETVKLSRFHQPDSSVGISSKKRPSETEIDTPLQHKNKQPRLTKPVKNPSLVKAAVLGSAKMNGIPMVEGVKISNDKLKFSKTGTDSTNQTPIRANQNSSLKLRLNMAKMRNAKTSPESGDNIILPEIMSESEDDDEGNILQDWANSPELRALLDRQQKIDPDAIFGPMPPLRMEEVFEKSTRLSRLRPRSSSANWSGQDKLTQQEIDKYSVGMGYLK